MRFNTVASAAALAVALVGLAGVSGVAQAESSVTNGNSTSARLDFRVRIPQVIFLQVGSGAFLTNSDTVNRIDFLLTEAQAANPGTAVAASTDEGGGGDLDAGTVTARVFGNAGQLTLSSASPAQLSDGANVIPWNEITVTAAGGAPAHPTFSASGAQSSETLVANPGGIVNLNGSWAYQYANTVSYAAGTYIGQITYTLTAP
jgi:hypothetical protein